ncbi:acylphosphatase-2-like isoform X1 [Engraulis encrasicolus]|uniref:acylphosphatase-2-like isoform X1 n=1 Tax=Engraulis encrasicolus TaxID=184585 RepID=UPI002FD54933
MQRPFCLRPPAIPLISPVFTLEMCLFPNEKEGLSLGCVGWVKNTNKGTVVGQVQGPKEQVKEMKVWLSKEGSPSSRIMRAVFTNERDIPQLELSGFGTRF